MCWLHLLSVQCTRFDDLPKSFLYKHIAVSGKLLRPQCEGRVDLETARSTEAEGVENMNWRIGSGYGSMRMDTKTVEAESTQFCEKLEILEEGRE